MVSMIQNEEEPLHSGEIYHLWNFLYDGKANIVTLQVLINHSGEQDLKIFLEDLLENCFEEESSQIEGFLKELGIRLPPAPPDRPHVELQDIPAGARFNDAEIASIVKKELTYGRTLCSYIIGCSAQEFVRTLFEEFHSERASYEQKLLTISKEKGWITSPPISVN